MLVLLVLTLKDKATDADVRTRLVKLLSVCCCHIYNSSVLLLILLLRMLLLIPYMIGNLHYGLFKALISKLYHRIIAQLLLKLGQVDLVAEHEHLEEARLSLFNLFYVEVHLGQLVLYHAHGVLLNCL